MKMIKIYLILIAFSISLTGLAQEQSNGKLIKAEESFNNYAYSDAIENYSEANDGKIETIRNLAESFYRIGNLEKAEVLYGKIVNEGSPTPNDVFMYANSLMQNGKYDEARTMMTKYNEMNPEDSRGVSYLSNPGFVDLLMKDKNQFVVRNLNINSEQEDFSPVYFNNKIVFASSREGVKSIKRKWNWNSLPFLDVYVADRNSNGNLENPKQLNKKLNKKFHEGPVCFNKSEDLMFFTRNNYDGKSEDDVIKLQMFYSKVIDGQWAEPKPFSLNNSEYSVGHASISADDKWIYFASDMPGGLGGVDIYKIELHTDMTFGEPINLGPEINTEGNEMFPNVHSTEMMFYSSDGRPGLGGLDIYAVQLLEDGSIGNTKNIGTPINSSRDDFSFILNKKMTNGYFSSNRLGGKGDDDLYYFDMLKPITFGKVLQGITKDKKGEILAETKVYLYNQDKEILDSIVSDGAGAYAFNVDADLNFILSGVKRKYFDGKNTADTHTEEPIIYADIELEKDPGLSLYALITDAKSGSPLDSVNIKITDNITGETVDFMTPITGDYRRPLTGKKFNDRGSYNLIIDKQGYLSKTVTYNTLFDRPGIYNVHEALDLTLDKIEVGGDLSKIIDINPIYFDLNKSRIRPDAAIELDKIVKVMNENPNMVVELGSHTDSRGSVSSNRSLSDRRAKASAAYIAERISNPERIYGKGFGESTPNQVDASADGGEVNQVLTEPFINAFKSKNRKLYDKYHQFNRRTEFIIIKM